MSKSFWGGLRVGWLRAEADVVRRLAAVAGHTQMSGPVLEQLAACHLLDAEEEVLTARRADLRRQRDGLRLPYTRPVDVIERGVELIADAAREVPSTRPVDQAMAQQIVV